MCKRSQPHLLNQIDYNELEQVDKDEIIKIFSVYFYNKFID